MAESTFSWLKLASFIGAVVLVILAFALIAGGIYQIVGGDSFHGVAGILGGLLSGIVALSLYHYYQRKSLENR